MAYTWRVLAKILTAIGAAGCVGLLAYSLFLIGNYATGQMHTPQPERGWTIDRIWTDPIGGATLIAGNRLLWIPCWFAGCLYLIVLGQAMNIYVPDAKSGMEPSKGPAACRRTTPAISDKVNDRPRLRTRYDGAGCTPCATEAGRMPASFARSMRYPADTSTCRRSLGTLHQSAEV